MATAKKTKKIATKKSAPSKKKVVAKPVVKKVVSKNLSKAKVTPKKNALVKKSKSPKKTVVQKKQTSKTVATKKISSKKSTQKKVVISKTATKKPEPKKSVAKPAVKKTAPKKPESKKVVSKKAPEKKSAKPAKPVAKKAEKFTSSIPEKKKSAPKAESVVEKKSKASKKSAESKKHTISVAEAIAEILKNKKPKAPAKVEKPLPTDNSKQRACAGIYFSIDDLDNYLATRDTVKIEDDSSAVSASSSKKKSEKVSVKATVQVPKRALAAASIADILGFNPIEESRSAFEEKDVPAKWKKYYKLLVEMKDRIQYGSSDKVESVSSSNIQLSHENSTQGMDVADIGAKNFERDMAFNLLSNEQNIISEVNAAIERIRNGTYGICEITGKQIPESRLLAVPFTRCTIEGQKQKEIEQRRLKAGQRKQQYDVDLSSDNQEPDVSEDDTE